MSYFRIVMLSVNMLIVVLLSVVESFDEGPGAVAARSRNRVNLLLAR